MAVRKNELKYTNCGPGAPLTVQRGTVQILLRYDRPMDPKSELFAEVRVGRRRQRTAYTSAHDHTQLLTDVLEILGFTPEILATTVDYDEDYSTPGSGESDSVE